MIEIRHGLAALALLALSGCSQGTGIQQSPLGVMQDIVQSRIAARQSNDTSPTAAIDIATFFSQADIATLEAPTLAGHVPSRGSWSILTQVSDSGGFQTYFTEDHASVTLHSGVVTETRGLTGDLLATSANPTLRAMSSGGTASGYVRDLLYLTPLSRTVTSRYTCRMSAPGREAITIAQRSHATLRYTESCTSSDHEFTNQYWRDQSSGRIIRSRQWIHQISGYLELFTLKS